MTPETIARGILLAVFCLGVGIAVIGLLAALCVWLFGTWTIRHDGPKPLVTERRLTEQEREDQRKHHRRDWIPPR
jgi:hypothetical protein